MVECSTVHYELRFYLFDPENGNRVYLWGQLATAHQMELGLLDQLAEFCAKLPFMKGKVVNVKIKIRGCDE